MSDTDLFTRGYGAIRAALQASEDFNRAVKVGNWIDQTTDGRVRKVIHQARTPATTPEGELKQGAFDLGLNRGNSKSACPRQTYTLFLSSDKIKVTDINALKEIILRAFARAGPKLGLPDLIWRVSVDTATEKDSQQNNLPGYSAALTFTLEMYKQRAQLV